ncbi:hypothetical protein C8R43DRAFT_1034055 [Mycena crocata]|nr:hypothetical protein C8R43DRAFT_1034055 [Mycena crocata]
MSESTTTARPILTRENYPTWYDDFEAFAGTKGLWRACTGAEIEPTAADPNAPTREERLDIEAYETRKSKASGEIWLSVEESLRDDLRELKGDPKAMMDALDSKHNQKAPGIRYKAYNNLLNVELHTDVEPALVLPTLVTEINNAVSFIRRQRPTDFKIEHLDAEIATMVALRALRNSENADHRTFATQFLMKEDLNFKDVESTILRDFQSKPTVKQEDTATSLAMAAQLGPCFLCEGPHWGRECPHLQKAKQDIKNPPSNRGSRGRGRGRGTANTSEGSSSGTPPAGAASANRATEFAGKVLLHT